jgi:hypothetical protein
LWPFDIFHQYFGVFYGRVAFLWPFWYIFSNFGLLHEYKSGNPEKICWRALIACNRCDRTGRIFRQLGDSLLWTVFYCKISSQFWGCFFQNQGYALILAEKLGRATLWAIFSQTHRVTLLASVS